VSAGVPRGEVQAVRGGAAGRRGGFLRVDGFLAARFALLFAADCGAMDRPSARDANTRGANAVVRRATAMTVVAAARRARDPRMDVIIVDGKSNSRSSVGARWTSGQSSI